MCTRPICTMEAVTLISISKDSDFDALKMSGTRTLLQFLIVTGFPIVSLRAAEKARFAGPFSTNLPAENPPESSVC